MNEFSDSIDGADACQSQIKKMILNSKKEVKLSVMDKSIIIKYSNNESLTIPIGLLTYCGALKQLKPEKMNKREFETLDKVDKNSEKLSKPLFVATFRNIKDVKKFDCYCFYLNNDSQATQLPISDITGRSSPKKSSSNHSIRNASSRSGNGSSSGSHSSGNHSSSSHSSGSGHISIGYSSGSIKSSGNHSSSSSHSSGSGHIRIVWSFK
ncbi:unnamed protein product [Brachionus calyciflorus]|uniref:Uncharacterized protein n=1 Tax=Brachionus calyciflorus TaxID=104777 RepID=A0A814EJ26_9BILA|nr:unnamed protein product [Brachionus calyciflorus]